MSPVPLHGLRVLTLATNVPGPVAAARLHHLEAEIIKIEPPAGDPLGHVCPDWCPTLAQGQRIHSLNLKVAAERAQLDPLLAHSDLRLTAMRPATLQRLALGWPPLHARYPPLRPVAILGYARPQENRAGYDLTYQAAAALLSPPELPRTLLADLAAAERVVSLALTLLLARERSQEGGYAHVALAEIAAEFAAL